MAIVITTDANGYLTVTEDGVERTLFPNTDDFNAYGDIIDGLKSDVTDLETVSEFLSSISGRTIASDKWSDIYEIFQGLELGYSYPVLIMPDAIKLITNNAITSSAKGVVGVVSENAFDFMLMLGNDRMVVFRVSSMTEEGTGTVSTIKTATMTTLS